MTTKTVNSIHFPSFKSCSFPATEALKQAEEEMKVAKKAKILTPSSMFEDSLSADLFHLSFNDGASAFPIIEWDLDHISDSSDGSMQSMDMWSSVLSDDSASSSSSSLGKRGRKRESKSNRRLMRSKKIKSNLASLALPIAADI